MAKTPTAVEIRVYQTGFGDTLLVSFVYSQNDKRHVLIDFGSTAIPTHLGKPAEHMRRIADHIKKTCEGQLVAVVATHRHADHISGFATDGKSGGSGNVIAECKPKVILQPWTEDPNAAKDAKAATADSSRSRKGFIASLSAMNRIADHAWRIGQQPPANMSATVAKQLRFLGVDNIKNRSAVENLIAMGKRSGAKAVWAHHGSNAGLVGKGLLEGVKVHVLGPPDLKQTEKIRKMRSKDPDQFWQLLGGKRFNHSGIASIEPGSRMKNGQSVPAEARWFRDRIARLSADQLLEIVRVLDDQMNNTSLILLFEVGGKKLLFPGDAQIENWSWALEDAPDAERTRKLLEDVDFYKVGHHGSRNATPKALLWDKFRKRGKGMKTALSTLKGKHGNSKKKTEVPRKTLLEALKEETILCNTEGFKFTEEEDPCQIITIKL